MMIYIYESIESFSYIMRNTYVTAGGTVISLFALLWLRKSLQYRDKKKKKRNLDSYSQLVEEAKLEAEQNQFREERRKKRVLEQKKAKVREYERKINNAKKQMYLQSLSKETREHVLEEYGFENIPAYKYSMYITPEEWNEHRKNMKKRITDETI